MKKIMVLFMDFYQIMLLTRDMIDASIEKNRLNDKLIAEMGNNFNFRIDEKNLVYDYLNREETGKAFLGKLKEFYEDTFVNSRYFIVETEKVIPSNPTKNEFLENIVIIHQSIELFLMNLVKDIREGNLEEADKIDIVEKALLAEIDLYRFHFCMRLFFLIFEEIINLDKRIKDEKKFGTDEQFDLNTIRIRVDILKDIRFNYRGANEDVKKNLENVDYLMKKLNGYNQLEDQDRETLMKEVKEFNEKAWSIGRNLSNVWLETYQHLLEKVFNKNGNNNESTES